MADDLLDHVPSSLCDIPAESFLNQIMGSPSPLVREDQLNVPLISTQQPILSQNSFSQSQNQPNRMSIPLFSSHLDKGKPQSSQVRQTPSQFHPPTQHTTSSRKPVETYAHNQMGVHHNQPGANHHQVGGNPLSRPITEVPERFRTIFAKYPYFNKVQSKVFDDVMYSDTPVVVASPTGSGKTVIFELAIIRLLLQAKVPLNKIKIVYMAPLKALCYERHADWDAKFNQFGLKSIQVTGDSTIDDYAAIRNSNIIMTTPEKWDSITRRWREHSSLIQEISLFLIDEAHMVGDVERGATIEAVVSRMKCIKDAGKTPLRFIAISATIPNAEDFAAWLTSGQNTAICFKLDESYRPVPLQKVVLSYNNCTPATAYKFDLNMNYKLHQIIQQYSPQSPTIVFCSTRKSTVTAAVMLQKEKRFVFNANDRLDVRDKIGNVVDAKLRDLIQSGIAYHHAGLTYSDRQIVESLFTEGFLPVICATSTLAMGVNLPAHLVIVKTTMHYVGGQYKEYSASDVLQMIGRAGRPQFDTSAVAVIMTQHATKSLYQNLIGGSQIVESSFHLNLTDHLNAEVVLKTLVEVPVAIQWMKSTFLYVRVLRNPAFYKLPPNVNRQNVEKFLESTVMKGLEDLRELGLISHQPDNSLAPTESGSLMARYCIAFNTMKSFTGLSGSEAVPDLLNVISNAHELSDVQLRVNEKSTLNTLNKSKLTPIVRYTFPNKIKTRDMKVNILIQATLGCLPINDFALNQESARIMTIASRLSKCLLELQNQTNTKTNLTFNVYVSSLILMKCLGAKLWENSKFLAKQLPNIGPAISSMLVNAGYNSLGKLLCANPREIELITNKNPPFGSTLISQCQEIPQYELYVRQLGEVDTGKASVEVTLKSTSQSPPKGKMTSLIIGTPENYLIYKRKFKDTFLYEEKEFKCQVQVHKRVEGQKIVLWLINHWYVGCDIKSTFSPAFKVDQSVPQQNQDSQQATANQSLATANQSLATADKSRNQNTLYYSTQNVHASKMDQKLQNSSRIGMNKPAGPGPQSIYQQGYNKPQAALKPMRGPDPCRTVVPASTPVKSILKPSSQQGSNIQQSNPTKPVQPSIQNQVRIQAPYQPSNYPCPPPQYQQTQLRPQLHPQQPPQLRPQYPSKQPYQHSYQHSTQPSVRLSNPYPHGPSHQPPQTPSTQQNIQALMDIDPAEFDDLDDLDITGLDDLDDSGFCDNVSGFELGLDDLLDSSQEIVIIKEIEKKDEGRKRPPIESDQARKFCKVDNVPSSTSSVSPPTKYEIPLRERKCLGDITNSLANSSRTIRPRHPGNGQSGYGPRSGNPGVRSFNPEPRPNNAGPRHVNPISGSNNNYNPQPYNPGYPTQYSNQAPPQSHYANYPNQSNQGYILQTLNQQPAYQQPVQQQNSGPTNTPYQPNAESSPGPKHSEQNSDTFYQHNVPTLNTLYETAKHPKPTKIQPSKAPDPHFKTWTGEDGEEYRECGHKCADKQRCSHFCCRYGVKVKKGKTVLASAEGSKPPYQIPEGSKPPYQMPAIDNRPPREVQSMRKTDNFRIPSRSGFSGDAPPKPLSEFEDTFIEESIESYSMYDNATHSLNISAHSIPKSQSPSPPRDKPSPPIPSLKDKYLSKFTSEPIVTTVETTQAPAPDISFYNRAKSSSTKSTVSSIFDGIF